MHDEASPLWTEMVDQTTRGHQFIIRHFGVDAVPRATWQIDPYLPHTLACTHPPCMQRAHSRFYNHNTHEHTARRFGHSNTQAWLMSAEAGMESMYWGRMDYQDRNMRFNKQQGTDGYEWVWQGSKSLGESAQIMAGNLFGTGDGGYSTFFGFEDQNNPHNQVDSHNTLTCVDS
jgi:alpha-mannosidase